jgi:hypothetical protein
MADQEGPADLKKDGWRFHVPVGLGFAGGLLLILFSEVAAAMHAISSGLKDLGLIVGGMLVGLVGISLYEVYGVAPERLRLEQERDVERARHQEERRLDFEEYRALQTELREARARASTLQTKLDLTGAIDRDRVGDALLIGFYFHRRADRLPSSSGRSIFRTAAERLKVISPNDRDVKLDKVAMHDVLQIAYGPVVAEAFDLGYLLSHLGEDGLPATSNPEILGELERHLKALKLGAEFQSRNGMPGDAANLFQRLASRIVSIVRR